MTSPSGRPLAVVGATATGKSSLAMELARRVPALEIVSIDSMQIYRDMDIGTAKPTLAERREVPHHLIDIADPAEEYSITRFREAADRALADIEGRGATPLLVGGTGLYLRAVVDRLDPPGRFPQVRAELQSEPHTTRLHARLATLDPVAATKMEPTNRRRIVRALEVTIGAGRPFSSFGAGIDSYGPCRFDLVGVGLPRPVIDRRIVARYEAQLEAGFLAEVEALHRRRPAPSRTARQALGYRQLIDHLDGRVSLVDAVAQAIGATRRFARRQERWFRRDPRITWLHPPAADADNPMAVLPQLLRHFSSCS